MAPNEKIISFDIESEIGFFKKPDINSGIYLTYNMLHKPALLGILGAIVGLKGYENDHLPEYYIKLKHLKVGIQPLHSHNGDYSKEIISYSNTTGMGMEGSNLLVKEQVLLNPSYRCYILLDMNDKLSLSLYERIMSYQAVFIPYMGKNEFGAWWTNAHEYKDPIEFGFERNFKISSLFRKDDAVKGYVMRCISMFNQRPKEPAFIYFERLPIGFDEELFQYNYTDFAFSNLDFSPNLPRTADCKYYDLKNESIIQLF